MPDISNPNSRELQRACWAVLAVLVFAVAFGGGGSKYGLANLVPQIAALVALSFHRRAFFRFWGSAPFALRGLIVASLILPVIHLLPLPSGIWAGLPGRDLVAQSFELAGGKEWSSLSVAPMRTLLALTALITPLAVISMGWSVPRDGLVWIGWFVVGLGLANFAIGVPQVLSNGATGLLYPENPMPGTLFGSFANRNSTGLFLVGALTLATILPPLARFGKAALMVRIFACVLLVLAIILTRSRTAIVLGLIPVGILAARFILSQLSRRDLFKFGANRNALVLAIPAALLTLAIGGMLLTSPGRLGDALDRFDRTEDARSYIWEDAVYSADRYWPAGSGMGTFDDVFQVDESLENMTLRRAGRAHNDYIEVTIEAGLPGLLLVAGWLVLLFWLSWRARSSPERWIAWSGALILLAIALQSITDYPLRNLSLLTLASYALLLLARFGAFQKPHKQEILP